MCTQRAPGALRPRRRLQHSRSTGRSAVRVRSAVAAAVHTAVLTGGRGARGYACTPEKALCAISHSTNRPPPLSRTLTPRSERTPYHGVCYNTGARVYIRVLKRAGAAAALARTSSGRQMGAQIFAPRMAAAAPLPWQILQLCSQGCACSSTCRAIAVNVIWSGREQMRAALPQARVLLSLASARHTPAFRASPHTHHHPLQCKKARAPGKRRGVCGGGIRDCTLGKRMAARRAVWAVGCRATTLANELLRTSQSTKRPSACLPLTSIPARGP